MIRVRERLFAAPHFGRTWHLADIPDRSHPDNPDRDWFEPAFGAEPLTSARSVRDSPAAAVASGNASQAR